MVPALRLVDTASLPSSLSASSSAKPVEESPFRDPTAVHALLRELAPKVKAIVRAVLGSSNPDVDDVHQQALIGLVQALPAYRGDCELLGYARIIAVRAAIAARRRSRVLQMHRDDEAEPELIEGKSPSPAESRANIERQEILRELLAELPSEQSETLALRVIFGLSLEEVARETGAPVNTVRSRVRLAKDRLKKRIEGDARLSAALL